MIAMAVSVVMPQLGESVVEGTITKWLVKEGDAGKKDQPIVEGATDKADSEVPSPAAGVIGEILAAEGATVPTNSQIASIEPAGATGATAGAPSAADKAAAKAVGAVPSKLVTEPSLDPTPRNGESAGTVPPQSPAVRQALRQLGVDVSQVTATGERG